MSVTDADREKAAVLTAKVVDAMVFGMPRDRTATECIEMVATAIASERDRVRREIAVECAVDHTARGYVVVQMETSTARDLGLVTD